MQFLEVERLGVGDLINLAKELTYSPSHSLTHARTHPLTPSLIHSLIQLFTHSLTHSLIHSLTYSPRNIHQVTLSHISLNKHPGHFVKLPLDCCHFKETQGGNSITSILFVPLVPPVLYLFRGRCFYKNHR